MSSSNSFDRYSRQIRFRQIGESGQAKLASSSAVICGCGALGTVIANILVRAGVGRLTIVDRDFVDKSNLQRQVLFDEQDAAAGVPKAIAAAEKLRKINSEVEIHAEVQDVRPENGLALLGGHQVILDGTDNFETRFLINDIACELQIPWVFGGCLGAVGQTMTILPGSTACLRCLMPEGPPPPESLETCDTAGVVASITSVIGSIQAMEGIKLLSGNGNAINRNLQIFDLWGSELRTMRTDSLTRERKCPTCDHGERKWLHGIASSRSTILCGRNAVQVQLPINERLDLISLAKRIPPEVIVTSNRFLLRVQESGHQVTLFEDGRAIVSGTEDPTLARTLYARWFGS